MPSEQKLFIHEHGRFKHSTLAKSVNSATALSVTGGKIYKEKTPVTPKICSFFIFKILEFSS